ncbi:MAG: proteasome assembly chaperone family protein [Thermoprotei archaeon]|nr:MAG: proteasome assembly chaperone family protein [Thermoprotei archaeon]
MKIRTKRVTLEVDEGKLSIDSVKFLITGFQGFGAVGQLASKYLTKTLHLIRIGYIIPSVIPDFTSLEDYGLTLPHEIFANNELKIITIVNHVNPSRRDLTDYTNVVVEFVKKLNTGHVLLIGGLDERFKEGDEKYRWLPTSKATLRLNAPLFMKGPYIVGPLASLLIAFELHSIPAITILPYTQPSRRVDPRAAAVAIEVISSLLGTEIPTHELIEYAEYLEKAEEEVRKMLSTQERSTRDKMYM